MLIEVKLHIRGEEAFANGNFDGETFIVLAGGKIRTDFANHIRGGKKAKSYRDNREFVDETGNILKDCIFTSPSTAAQFVTGRSTNGYEAWKVDDKTSLGKYMKENRLR